MPQAFRLRGRSNALGALLATSHQKKSLLHVTLTPPERTDGHSREPCPPEPMHRDRYKIMCPETRALTVVIRCGAPHVTHRQYLASYHSPLLQRLTDSRGPISVQVSYVRCESWNNVPRN